MVSQPRSQGRNTGARSRELASWVAKDRTLRKQRWTQLSWAMAGLFATTNPSLAWSQYVSTSANLADAGGVSASWDRYFVGAGEAISVVRAQAQQALALSPDLKSRQQSWQSAVEVVQASKAGYFPRVDMTGSMGRDQITQGKSMFNAHTSTVYGDVKRYGLSVVQPLFDGFATSQEVQRQARFGNVRYFEFLQSQEEIAYDFVRAHIDVERQRYLLAQSRSYLKTLQELQELVRSRVESGLSRRVDYEQAMGRIASARATLAADEAALAEAASRYQRLAFRPPSELALGIPLLSQGLPDSPRELVRRGLLSYPALAAAEESVAAVDAELGGRKSAYMPRLNLEGRHEFMAKSAVTSQQSLPSSSVLMTLNMNLYAGGADRARERETLARKEAARESLSKQQADHRHQLVSLFADVQRLRTTGVHLRDYVEGTRKTLDAYVMQYKINQRSLLDLLNTHGEIFQAERQAFSAKADLAVSYAHLHVLCGSLAETLGLSAGDVRPLIAVAERSVGEGLWRDLSREPAADPVATQRVDRSNARVPPVDRVEPMNLAQPERTMPAASAEPNLKPDRGAVPIEVLQTLQSIGPSKDVRAPVVPIERGPLPPGLNRPNWLKNKRVFVMPTESDTPEAKTDRPSGGKSDKRSQASSAISVPTYQAWWAALEAGDAERLRGYYDQVSLRYGTSWNERIEQSGDAWARTKPQVVKRDEMSQGESASPRYQIRSMVLWPSVQGAECLNVLQQWTRERDDVWRITVERIQPVTAQACARD